MVDAPVANPIPFQGDDNVRFAEVVSALSYALDITEGQPEGHAMRSCMIGMRIGSIIGFDETQLSSLFYALLLKDLGCSSNAAKVCYLFGADDQTVKQGFKYTNWQSVLKSVPYIMNSVAPEGSFRERFATFLKVAIAGTRGAKELVAIRCERGASIARDLHLPEDTVQAIRNLDEHWNGKGHPDGLGKHQIPLMARILGISQTVEVFASRYGLAAALDIAHARRKTWFDPELVRAFLSLGSDTDFWMRVMSPDVREHVSELEPRGHVLRADAGTVDRLCGAFAQVIDAKSPWTACHSQGVSDVAVGIAGAMGLRGQDLTNLRRAGLLHDVGKLGVSNRILDKPGKLTDLEFEALKAHPGHTYTILARSSCFAPFAQLAARHHEKLDGSGYHKGLDASRLTKADRILAVADMYEALAAKRPYRQDMTGEEVFAILQRCAGKTICAESVAALRTFIDQSGFVPYQVAA